MRSPHLTLLHNTGQRDQLLQSLCPVGQLRCPLLFYLFSSNSTLDRHFKQGALCVTSTAQTVLLYGYHPPSAAEIMVTGPRKK